MKVTQASILPLSISYKRPKVKRLTCCLTASLVLPFIVARCGQVARCDRLMCSVFSPVSIRDSYLNTLNTIVVNKPIN